MSELDVNLAGKSLADYTNAQLRVALGTALYTNTADMWRAYLVQQGYSGSVADMMAKWYVDNNVPYQFRNYISAGAFISSAFTPASLFVGGYQGAWYDFSDMSVLFQDSAGITPVTAVEQPIGLVLDKSGNGNHATQATSSKRPVLSARKNIYKYTEEFSNGYWASVSVKPTITSDVISSPIGTLTADKWTPPAVLGTYGCHGNNSMGAGSYTHTVYAKNAGYNRIGLRAYDGTSYFIRGTVDLTAGTMVADGSQAGTWSVTNAGNGWWKIVVSGTAVGSFAMVSMEVLNTTLVQSAWTPNGVDGIYVWGAQLEYGLTATAYQRVTTDTDYDTIGFPHYANFDGVDDSLSSGSIDFSSTNSSSAFVGLVCSASGLSVPFEFATNSTNVNSGTFNTYLSGGGAYDVTPSQNTNASYGFCSSAGGLVSSNSVIALTYSGASAVNTNIAISARRNASSLSLPTNTGTVGTSNFGNHPLYIGARAGSSLFFSGKIYQLCLVGKTASGTEITKTETYINGKTGAY